MNQNANESAKRQDERRLTMVFFLAAVLEDVALEAAAFLAGAFFAGPDRL